MAETIDGPNQTIKIIKQQHKHKQHILHLIPFPTNCLNNVSGFHDHWNLPEGGGKNGL